MTALLIIVRRGEVRGRMRLDGGETTIGRAEDSDLRLVGRGVSRHHATLRYGVAGYVISDLASTNGVEVNGEQRESSRLFHGDTLQIGEFELRYQDFGQRPVPTITQRSYVASGTDGGVSDETVEEPAWYAQPRPAEPARGVARALSQQRRTRQRRAFDATMDGQELIDDLLIEENTEKLHLRSVASTGNVPAVTP